MKDYQNLGLDKNLKKIDSLAVKPQQIQGIDFESDYEIQTKRIRASQSAITDLIRNSGSTTASGSFTNTGQTLVITTTLTPDPSYLNSRLLALPQVNVYQGTAIIGTLQMYPGRGAGITVGDYEFSSGYDQQTTNGTNMVYRILVENVNRTGTTQVFIVSQWRYIQENAGISSEQ